jgi:hypothetical protein
MGTTKVQYVAGLSLGQPHEFTALAVLEKTSVGDPQRSDSWAVSYAVRHLERFALATPYADVFARLKALFADAPLKKAPVVVDRTGVGKAVVDLLDKAAVTKPVWDITVTTGLEVVKDGRGGYQVPKKDLVAVLQVLLQTRRLKVAESLPEAATLTAELTDFRAKVTPSGADPVVDWRERPHDDLVLAVAAAAWWGERLLLPGAWGPLLVFGGRSGW